VPRETGRDQAVVRGEEPRQAEESRSHQDDGGSCGHVARPPWIRPSGGRYRISPSILPSLSARHPRVVRSGDSTQAFSISGSCSSKPVSHVELAKPGTLETARAAGSLMIVPGYGHLDSLPGGGTPSYSEWNGLRRLKISRLREVVDHEWANWSLPGIVCYGDFRVADILQGARRCSGKRRRRRMLRARRSRTGMAPHHRPGRREGDPGGADLNARRSGAHRLRIVSTGQAARRTNRSATLPMSTLERPVRPWVPITSRSARVRRTARRICS
jgi:hypothetical protein